MMKCRTRQILQHESKVVHNRRRPCQQVFIVQPSLSQIPKNLRGSGDSSGEGVHMHTAPRGRVTTVGCAFEPTRRSTNSMKGQNTSVAVSLKLNPSYPAAKQKTCLPLPSVNFSSARVLPWLRDGFNRCAVKEKTSWHHCPSTASGHGQPAPGGEWHSQKPPNQERGPPGDLPRCLRSARDHCLTSQD